MALRYYDGMIIRKERLENKKNWTLIYSELNIYEPILVYQSAIDSAWYATISPTATNGFITNKCKKRWKRNVM